MESAELVYKVQQLSQAAGLAHNEHHPAKCTAHLMELRDLLIEQNFEIEKVGALLPEEETETEQSEQAPPGEETQDEPGPESQPSEQ